MAQPFDYNEYRLQQLRVIAGRHEVRDEYVAKLRSLESKKVRRRDRCACVFASFTHRPSTVERRCVIVAPTRHVEEMWRCSACVGASCAAMARLGQRVAPARR